MCGILDSCRFHDFLDPNNKDGRAFREWAETSGSLVFPGAERLKNFPAEVVGQMKRLAGEFARNPQIADYLAALNAQGRARRVKLSDVARRYVETAAAKSNDRHILALALASGARLLYTEDGPLSEDFTDPQVISKPRGTFTSARRTSICCAGMCASPRPGPAGGAADNSSCARRAGAPTKRGSALSLFWRRF